jgi:hypothetical protein
MRSDGHRASGEGGFAHEAVRDARPRRRSWFRRTAGFVAEPFRVHASEVGEGWAFIGALWQAIRTPRARTRVIRLDQAGRFDTAAMASDALVSESEIELRLDNRQRETRWQAKIYLLGGVCALAVWFYEIVTQGITGMNPIDVVWFLLVVCLLLSFAFFNAFVNWQIRTRRLGTVLQFFMAEESWWPR